MLEPAAAHSGTTVMTRTNVQPWWFCRTTHMTEKVAGPTRHTPIRTAARSPFARRRATPQMYWTRTASGGAPG